MTLRDRTPFRQLSRAYAALTQISQVVSELPSAQRADLKQAMRGDDAALGRIRAGLANPVRAVEVAALRERVDQLEQGFDRRVADAVGQALRDRMHLPPPDLADPQRPFMAWSTCSAADFLHPGYVALCAELHHPLQYHRKLWEWLFVLHHLRAAGVLQPGRRGLGFGVGRERMPAVFARDGVHVMATDAPLDIGVASGWSDSAQHSEGLAQLSFPEILDDELLEQRVSHGYCDMNAIRDDLQGFDFTWSCCCFEHLGSLQAGMDFVVNSVQKTLRPGGVAVHTTEYNLSSNDETIDTGGTVLYRRRDMDELVQRLRDLGHEVQPFCVAPDSHFLDFHVDVPPYGAPHLKMRQGHFVTTSAGIVVRKR